jgi:hypothetical protein
MSESHHDKEKAGWVYACFNHSIPGLVKIGETGKTPEERIKELSASTSVPTPFLILCAVHVSNCYKIEQELHAFYADRRYGKEFFSISHEEVVARFSTITGESWVSDPKIKPATNIGVKKNSTYAEFKQFHDHNIALEEEGDTSYNRPLDIIRRICKILDIPNTTTTKTWTHDEWNCLVPKFNSKQTWPNIGHSSLIEIAMMEFGFKSEHKVEGGVGADISLKNNLQRILKAWSGMSIVNLEACKPPIRVRTGGPLPPFNEWQKKGSAVRITIETEHPDWDYTTQILPTMKALYDEAKAAAGSSVKQVTPKIFRLQPYEISLTLI